MRQAEHATRMLQEIHEQGFIHNTFLKKPSRPYLDQLEQGGYIEDLYASMNGQSATITTKGLRVIAKARMRERENAVIEFRSSRHINFTIADLMFYAEKTGKGWNWVQENLAVDGMKSEHILLNN